MHHNFLSLVIFNRFDFVNADAIGDNLFWYHHNIKTAYKLVPGMFYRICLFKKKIRISKIL